jgi:hypothetical protein
MAKKKPKRIANNCESVARDSEIAAPFKKAAENRTSKNNLLSKSISCLSSL